MTNAPSVTGHAGAHEQSFRFAPGAEPPVHARYELLDVIGSGSMGVVYRAFDRLSGQLVTLKRLRTQHDQAGRMRSSRPADRVALAHEFRLLATLRHPNVIGVLDYGFDRSGQPFFTMILEEGGRSIVDAARGRTLEEQVALLVETLRGLAYVHRRGIVHRDVKPDNILVVDGHVRLLDFGLSALREDLVPEGSLTGTFDYLAPEVLRGGAPTERSDLFAVGVIAYEIVAGRHPFAADDLATSWANVLTGPLPLPDPAVDPRLEPVLARLLERDPAARFADASEIAAALAAAVGTPVSFETTASRESFLQQAAFVGRTFEIDVLGEALVTSLAGRGSTWLVGGESGVGKSRLLEELRVLALVQGVTVARGQAVSVGGAPYQTWREPLRLLALNATSLDDRLIAALEPAVPDVAALLGRRSVAADEIDDEATQTRLLHAVQELLRRQRTPVAILLEDLQWAGSESVNLLAGLARVASGERVIAVASYRREERPSLPDEIPGARSLQLGRLGEPAVRALAESMIGDGASAPAFVEYLCRETEGVPFFLVEVVRALADEAGDLAHVPHGGLPKLAVPGGIQQLLRRRLSRVGASELQALRAAAVVGREIDEQIMRALDPLLDDDVWLTTCAAAGILDAEENRFRFAHDKIREQLVADLGEGEAVGLHRRVALAIEAAHSDSEEYAAALAHHWRAAHDAVREAHHAARAGFHALESGAWREAIGFFERALVARHAAGLEPQLDTVVARRSIVRRLDPNSRVAPRSGRFEEARLESGIAEAWFRLGDLEACRRHGVRALRLGGLRVPDGPLQLGAAIARQGIRRVLQSAARVGADDAAAEVARELVRVQTRLTESYFFSPEAGPLLWLVLLMTNQCAPLGASSELAKTYMVLGLLTGALPLRRTANALCRRSVRMGEQSCSRAELAYLLTRVNNHRFGSCDWATADAEIARAAVLAEQVGDHRVWQEARSMQGMSALFQGRFADGVVAWRDAQLSAERSGNWQIECWALMGQADNLVRLGRESEAIPLYERALERFAGRARTTEEIWCSGMLALALLRSGDELGAERRARRALGLVSGVTTVAYWTQFGTAATAEVLLALAERSSPRSPVRGDAERATRAMRRYARSFRLGRPFALLLRGHLDRIEGRAGAADRRWRAAAAWAERLGTPYELAGAQRSLGLHARDPEQCARHLARAAELYGAMGSVRDLAAVDAARVRTGDAR